MVNYLHMFLFRSKPIVGKVFSKISCIFNLDIHDFLENTFYAFGIGQNRKVKALFISRNVFSFEWYCSWTDLTYMKNDAYFTRIFFWHVDMSSDLSQNLWGRNIVMYLSTGATMTILDILRQRVSAYETIYILRLRIFENVSKWSYQFSTITKTLFKISNY